MIYTVENEFLKVELSTLGAELQSIFGKKSKHEYLWQGSEEYWKNRSTVLFPICGRLTEGKYTYGGNTYEMMLHGFAKLTEFTLEEIIDESVTLSMTSNTETKKIYPFDFKFLVKYTLSKNKVKEEFTVENKGIGDLPFSLGAHPGFNLPLKSGYGFCDYTVEFNNPDSPALALLSPTCFCTGEYRRFLLRDEKYLDMTHSLFDNDAVFIKGMGDSVTLKAKDDSKPKVTVSYKDMTHLGFWHKPHTEAPFVCIEPWHGIPAIDGVTDDFSTKRDFIHLSPSRAYNTYVEIEIEE